MNKGLEALNRIGNMPTQNDMGLVMINALRDYDIIEKELKEGEKAQFKLKALGNFVLKSKALEIIKKYIHIYCVAPDDRGGVRIWFTSDGEHYIDMPQEEYNLLKEVLL